LNLAAVVLVAVVTASVLTPTAFVLFDNVQTQMAQLGSQESTIMNGTMGFLDRAWGAAQGFQNSSYNYDPSELGNYSVAASP